MTKRIAMLLVLLFAVVTIYAQSNFKSGYIIKNEADTIRGLIDFKSDKANVAHCRFKLNADSPIEEFKPGEIAGYRLDEVGKYYVSREIMLSGLKKMVFVEYLVKGTTSLYFYPAPEGDMYFFDNDEADMVGIMKGADIQDGRLQIGDTRFQRTVYDALGSRPDMMGTINKTNFSRQSLIETVRKHHELTCEPGVECIEFENDYKRDFVKAEFTVYAGVRFNNYRWNRINGGATNRAHPEIGVQMLLMNPRFSRSLAMTFDVVLSGVKAEGVSKLVTNFKKESSDFKALMVGWKVGGQYMYPKGLIRPVVGAGFAAHYMVGKSKNMAPIETELDPLPRNVPPNVLNGFTANAGLDIILGNNKTLSLRIAHDILKEYADDNISTGGETVRDKLNMTQVTVGYKF